jgi:Zn-dependent protease with chaperone function
VSQLTIKHALVIAITFGIVAALVVWWLERFEINKFHGEVQHYIRNYDKFEEFLKRTEGTNGS